MKTISNIDEVRFVNFEINEEYQFNLEGMKVASAILKVTGKDKGRGSGKKSVIFGELTLTDAEGKATIYTQTDEIADKGGWDITTLKNKLMGTTTTQRGQRKAEDFEVLAKLFDDVKNTLTKIEDYLTEEEAIDADLTNIYNKLTQAKDASVTRLEATSKKARANQEEAYNLLKQMTPEQIEQFLQMQRA